MDKLLKILKRIKPEVDLTMYDALVDEGILDSLDIVSIIFEIETEYSIEVDPDDIDPENFQTVTNIYEMIKKIMMKKKV